MTENIPPGYQSIESKISGIKVFMPSPEPEEEQPAVVVFKCPRCGGTTSYDITQGGLKCPYCGYTAASAAELVGKQADEEEFTPENLARTQRGYGIERREMVCQSCGATTSVPADHLAHACAFCGSNKVLQRVPEEDGVRPSFLVRFQRTPEECRKISTEWLGSSWMTPSDLAKLAATDAFSPVYLPYWTFDAITAAAWKAQVGHTVTERYYNPSTKSWDTRTRIDWRWESGRVRLNMDDVLLPGTRRLSALHLGKINVFDMRGLVTYEPSYLAGMQALRYDIDLETSWEAARYTMREKTRDACRKQASTSMIRNFSMSLDFADESWRHILLPVYIAAYRYANQSYQVLINGQTGTISGQRPVDWNKVWLVIAAILAPGVLTSLVGLFTMLMAIGVPILAVGAFLLLVGIIISIVIGVQANKLDDA